MSDLLRWRFICKEEGTGSDRERCQRCAEPFRRMSGASPVFVHENPAGLMSALCVNCHEALQAEIRSFRERWCL